MDAATRTELDLITGHLPAYNVTKFDLWQSDDGTEYVAIVHRCAEMPGLPCQSAKAEGSDVIRTALAALEAVGLSPADVGRATA